MKTITYLIFLFFSGIILAQPEISEAKNLLEQQKISEAEQILKEILESQSKNQEVISILGDIASFKKDWDAAINYYGKLVEEDPNNVEYNFNYGGALGMKALEVPKVKALIYISDIKNHLEKAAELDPGHVESRRALVELYMQLPMLLGGSQDKAETYVSELRSISAVDYFLAKGFVYLEVEGAAAAKPWYIRSFQVYEKVPESKRRNNVNYELGKASGEMNIFPEKGLVYLSDYTKNYSYKDIHQPECIFYRKAQIHANLKRKSEALKNINKALTLRPNFDEAKEEKERILNL